MYYRDDREQLTMEAVTLKLLWKIIFGSSAAICT